MPPPATEQRLHAAWARRGLGAWLLMPVAGAFGALAAVRRALYRRGLLRSSRLERPVVVIGNLVVGGAGKTPLVLALINALRARGYTPGVISRGHGAAASAQGAVLPATPDAATYGDEPSLIKRRSRVPLAICADRVRAGQLLLAAHPEVDIVLSDDGLQHYRLARAVEVAVFDARGAGNGWLLPAGPLREPLTRLRTVDALVFNGEVPGGAALVAHAGGVPAYPMRIRAGAAWSLSDPTRLRPLTSLRGVTLQAVAGIGQPQRFFDLLRAAGLQFTPVPLSDHHDFRGHVFSGGPQDLILMTEKDAVKCLASNDPRLWAVPIDAEIPPGLVTLILEKLRGSATA